MKYVNILLLGATFLIAAKNAAEAQSLPCAPCPTLTSTSLTNTHCGGGGFSGQVPSSNGTWMAAVAKGITDCSTFNVTPGSASSVTLMNGGMPSCQYSTNESGVTLTLYNFSIKNCSVQVGAPCLDSIVCP
ncbi:MAG: hypothetical protein JSR85_03765 [Proteobacteria bacterium]|nr:hypothetical protein [Pseudomonadota bacterium]